MGEFFAKWAVVYFGQKYRSSQHFWFSFFHGKMDA
jgi:hypothetical protein